MNKNWPATWTVHLGPDYPVELPLMDLGNGFFIYSFDMTGEAEWNRHAARALQQKLSRYDFYSFVTVQTKSSGLTQTIASEHKSYLELRKSRKGFMQDPKHIVVKSITTENQQELWIGKEKYAQFQGKKLCFIDDVVSTGGTIDAVLAMSREIGFEISVIACVLTEGENRTEYEGIPLVSLDHIPLPGFANLEDLS
ncbi:MAG: phosphoribosyltransferase family protein [Eubacteriales bacterium]|nr:phosphoribosyltransferase family protein [Eubacteriales bacterium]